MSHSDDDSSIMFIGGGIAVVVIGMLLVRVIGEFFLELGIAFNNFGKMMGSFVFMLWNTLEVVSLVVLILAAIAAGIYFSIRYFRAVKELTATREWFEGRSAQLHQELSVKIDEANGVNADSVSSLKRRIQKLDEQLSDALKKTEVAPPTPELTQVSPNNAPHISGLEEQWAAEAAEYESEEKMDSDEESDEDATSPDTEKVTMSNPY